MIDVLRAVLGDDVDRPTTPLYARLFADPTLVLRLERALLDTGVVIYHTELYLCETVGDLLALVGARTTSDRHLHSEPDEDED